MLSVLAEFLGTFFFLSVILFVGKPIPIAVALLASIYSFGSISGGHFNPAVSSMMLVKGDIDVVKFLMYVIAQILGGLTALAWYMTNKKKK